MRETLERGARAGKEDALIGDMGLVMREEVAHQRLDPLGRERRPVHREPALDQRARAGADETAGRLRGDGRQALASQQHVQGRDQVMGGVRQSAVEIKNDYGGARDHLPMG